MKRAPLAVFAAAALLAPLMATAQFTVRPWTQDNAPLDERVAADFREIRHPAAFVHYAVPAMSPLQRLPDVYPEDGIRCRPHRRGQGRYEPGSFLIRHARQQQDAALADAVQKCRWQALPRRRPRPEVRQGLVPEPQRWYSYFGDTGFKLVPELLVNDEDLIRVDTAYRPTTAPQVRRRQDGQIWINPPRAITTSSGISTVPYRPSSRCGEFRDAPTLQPVKFPKEFRNFFLPPASPQHP